MTESKRSLHQSIAVGAVWMMLLRISYRLIGLISTIILARLLTTDDFGIAAIAMSIFALINTFSQFGFETVLIQKKEVSFDDYNTAWTFNFIFGVLAATLLFLLSPWVGEFYGNVDLEYITQVISILFLLHGVRNIGVVDFQKNLTFDKEFKLHIIPKFISFFITIALALYYENYWALVIGNVVWKTIEVMNSYLMHPFRPSISFTKSGELFSFSKWLIANNFLNFTNNKSPELVLGKIISPHAAAIFTLASELAQMSTSEVISNLNRAIYPGYAKVSHDLPALRELFQNSIRVIGFLVMPIGIGVALVASYIVELVLGGQWIDAVEPLKYLSLGAAIFALKSNVNYVYFALNKPRISSLELCLRATIFVGLMLYLIGENGVVGATQAFLISSVVMFVVSNIILTFILDISFTQQMRLYLKPLLASVLMAVCVKSYLLFFTQDILLLDFTLSVLIGVVSYVVFVFLIWFVTGRKEGIESQALKVIRSIVLRKNNVS